VAILRKAFGDQIWTFYPQKASLLSFIEIEEKSLLEKKEALETLGYDPGRKTYEEAYGTTPKLTMFDVFFRETVLRKSSLVCLQANLRDCTAHLQGSQTWSIPPSIR
jgi:hypothetical protein